jgi:hypothetical protein
MTNSVSFSLVGLGAVLSLTTSLFAADCCSDAPHSSGAEDGSNNGALTGSFGLNIASAYYNRGVLQNRSGLNYQPYANLRINAFEGDGPISRVDFHLGTWFNLSESNTRMRNRRLWSEIDVLPGVSVKIGNLTITETFHVAIFPANTAVNNFRGLETRVALDDKDALGAFALNPTFTHLASLGGGAGFGMGAGGHYWHFGVSPGVSVGPVRISVPAGIGFGSGEFYRTGNNGYAFSSVGLASEIKLPFDTESGRWTMNASITFYDFSRGNTGNPSVHDAVGRVGLGVSF